AVVLLSSTLSSAVSAPPPHESYPLPLHAALPILLPREARVRPSLRPRARGRPRRVGHHADARARLARGRGTDARPPGVRARVHRSEEHTSELQSLTNLVCRLLLETKTPRLCPFPS